MIQAFAAIHCDHPGCTAAISFAEPLNHGQLNPLQTQALRMNAESEGWVGAWGHKGDIPRMLHYCPEHAWKAAKDG